MEEEFAAHALATYGRDALDRADLEDAAVEQRHPADPLGALPEPSEPAACVLRHGPERRDSARAAQLRAQAAALARGREHHARPRRADDRSTDGPYGGAGIVQALAPEAVFPTDSGETRYPVLGLWMIDQECGGMGIRESSGPITGNLSSFVPHYFCERVGRLPCVGMPELGLIAG